MFLIGQIPVTVKVARQTGMHLCNCIQQDGDAEGENSTASVMSLSGTRSLQKQTHGNLHSSALLSELTAEQMLIKAVTASAVSLFLL